MKENLSSNIRFLRKKSGKSQSEIGFQLKKAHTSIGNWEKGISEPSLSEIEEIARIFEISAIDLLTIDLSKGNLIEKTESKEKDEKGNLKGNPNGNLIAKFERKTPKSVGEISPFLDKKNLGAPHVISINSTGVENIVHVPVKARAGYLLGYGDPQYVETLPTYTLPGLKHGTFRSFEASGHSMKPTILHHDYIVGKWVESIDDIRENRIHIIVTKNDGVLIKRVINRINERGRLYLKSDTITNKGEHPNIEIELEDIAEIWYCVLRFTPDFSDPNDYFTRIHDMELDIHELKKAVFKQ